MSAANPEVVVSTRVRDPSDATRPETLQAARPGSERRSGYFPERAFGR